MKRVPKLCHHKASNLGYVTDPATGDEVYFGKWGTPECVAAYSSWVQQLQARRGEVRSGTPPGTRVKVWQLLDDFLDHAEQHYQKHGKPTTEVPIFRRLVRQLNERHGREWADEFTPTRLKAMRELFVSAGHARGYVNREVGRIRAIWRWGVEMELVPVTVYHTLLEVRDLQKGRSPAPEEKPVQPVPLELVGETLFHLDGLTGSLVRLHLFGCMRAQDVVRIRPCDIDRTQDPWLYRPAAFKTEHHDGAERKLWLGPACQEILACRLPGLAATDWLFPGKGKGRHSGRYQGHLTTHGYAQRITRCCERNGLPHWCPAQLRHTALTEVRRRFGLEAAQLAAGHAHADVTQLYTARDEDFARRIAREMWTG
jgi:integrase